MENNKSVTAVEWLEEQTRTSDWHSLKRGDIFEQAKKIEKQQMKDAVLEQCTTHQGLSKIFDKQFEQYYNETFKQLKKKHQMKQIAHHQELFNYLYDELNAIALDSQMFEIDTIVLKSQKERMYSEEQFVLPKKWFLVVSPDNFEICKKWRESVSKVLLPLFNIEQSVCLLSKHETDGSYFYWGTKEIMFENSYYKNYKEITTEQFIKYVYNPHFNINDENKKNKDFFELESCIEQWAEDKGILSNATPLKQAMKTQEEVTELCNAIIDNNKNEVKDAIGDIIVTLIIQAKMQGVTIEECLNTAYNVISKRTGKMINGQFIKDN